MTATSMDLLRMFIPPDISLRHHRSNIQHITSHSKTHPVPAVGRSSHEASNREQKKEAQCRLCLQFRKVGTAIPQEPGEGCLD